MESSNNASPLLHYAIKTREKNVELRKKIIGVQNEIQSIEKDILTISNSHNDLVEQCRILREKQDDRNKDQLLEEYQTQFNAYLRDIENYINSKELNVSSIDRQDIIAPRHSSPIPTNTKIDIVQIPTISDDLNQHLASVENWLMESAVTDVNEPCPLITERQNTDDGTDDLYQDLIFPVLSDDLQTQTENIRFDENHHQNEFIKVISSESCKLQQHPPLPPPLPPPPLPPLIPQQPHSRLDKSQRRFALMRQLAEKSNKSVTRKLI